MPLPFVVTGYWLLATKWKTTMTITRSILISFLVIFVWASFVCADGGGIHLSGGKKITGVWKIKDGAGFEWNIDNLGTAMGGAYRKGGRGMVVSFASKAVPGMAGHLSKDGREIELGPWNVKNLKGIKVYRRIYVDAKNGYCRWIDIFVNTSESAVTIKPTYTSDVSISPRLIYSTSGKSRIDTNDWGAVTASSTGRHSSPLIAHIFATRGNPLKPRFSVNHRRYRTYYNITLEIKPRKTVALCFFEAIGKDFPQAKKCLAQFDVNREYQKIPQSLQQIIVNMGNQVIFLVAWKFEASETECLVAHIDDYLLETLGNFLVLRNGDRLFGTIKTKTFTIETSFGKLSLPTRRIIGLVVPSANDSHLHVGLLDGQIIGGKLVNTPLVIKLSNGNEMTIPPDKLYTLAFRISREKPEQIDPITHPMIVLRSGQQLFFRADDLAGDFQTEYGCLKLHTKNISSIDFDTLCGGMHRVKFINGSCLSGLLKANKLKFRLDLGKNPEIPRQCVKRIIISSKRIHKNPTVMTLRNNDTLHGRLADKLFNIKTPIGKVSVSPKDIVTMNFMPGISDPVQIRLRDGSTISGKFVAKTINFKMEPGPKIPIYVGHIVSIRNR